MNAWSMFSLLKVKTVPCHGPALAFQEPSQLLGQKRWALGGDPVWTDGGEMRCWRTPGSARPCRLLPGHVALTVTVVPCLERSGWLEAAPEGPVATVAVVQAPVDVDRVLGVRRSWQ